MDKNLQPVPVQPILSMSVRRALSMLAHMAHSRVQQVVDEHNADNPGNPVDPTNVAFALPITSSVMLYGLLQEHSILRGRIEKHMGTAAFAAFMQELEAAFKEKLPKASEVNPQIPDDVPVDVPVDDDEDDE